jgi:hypothetical protein
MGRAADPSPLRLLPKPDDTWLAVAKRLDAGAVSPELVLVDPELARTERAQLEERAKLAAYAAPLLPPSTLPEDPIVHAAAAADDGPKGVARVRRRLRPATVLVVLLFAALIAGGAAAAWSLAGGRGGATSRQQAVPIAAPPAGLHKVKAAVVRPGSPGVAWHAHRTSYVGRTNLLGSAHLLEGPLLALLAGAPASKLPRQLVDVGRRTARSDLRALCRRSGALTLSCVIRSPRRPPNEGLYVRYRMHLNGKGFFEWLGYRR